MVRAFSRSMLEAWIMKVRELIKLIEDDGWYHIKTKGSHRQFKHQTKPGKVTVPGNMGKDVPKGTLKSVLKQADIEQ